jgi:single-stranded-DNA-specific exonuclease
VVERYNRPTLVIAREGEEAFGSGRSIHAFHLLEAIESCADLFTRYGGHSHACGFAMPSANVPELRTRMDAFARARLTPADFEPVLEVESDLQLDEVTPALFRALQLLEPYGAGNHEPVFSACGVKLLAPPRILKDKHIKLKLTPGVAALASRVPGNGDSSRELPEAAIPRSEFPGGWRKSVTYEALGWHMAERLQRSPLLAGDAIDIAFTIGHNEHPEYGGLELSLRDFRAGAGLITG